MKTVCAKLTITVCVVLVTLQLIFITIPPGDLRVFSMAIRPVAYMVLVLAAYVFANPYKRPASDEAYRANIVAVMFAAIFGVIVLTLSFVFGAGTNPMVPSFAAVRRNLWDYGMVVVIGGYIRYKLVKSANDNNRDNVILALTLALALTHMPGMRGMLTGGNFTAELFFAGIFLPIVISGVASYFAFRGSLLSVLIISFVFQMRPYLMPIAPAVAPFVFTMVICATVFAAAFVFNNINNAKRRAMRKRAKLMAKYAKKSVAGYLATAAVIGVAVAFFAGFFPIYPIVVLTGSMSPALERGSIAFVERVPSSEAFHRVGEGEVIHFLARGGIPYIHRVVDFRIDAMGERVYITQGDAAVGVDPYPVAQGDVMGIARASLPFFGYPYIFFRSIFAR